MKIVCLHFLGNAVLAVNMSDTSGRNSEWWRSVKKIKKLFSFKNPRISLIENFILKVGIHFGNNSLVNIHQSLYQLHAKSLNRTRHRKFFHFSPAHKAPITIFVSIPPAQKIVSKPQDIISVKLIQFFIIFYTFFSHFIIFYTLPYGIWEGRRGVFKNN